MSPDLLLRWAPGLFLVLGVVFLVVAAVTLVLTLRFVAGAERATGTVIDLSRETDSEGEVVFYPVVSFTTAEGRTLEFRSSSGSSFPPQPGDRVEVLYDPDDPKDARLSGFFDLWGLPIVFGFIGAVASFVSVVFLRRTRGPSKADAAWLRAHGLRVRGDSPRVVYCDEIDVQGSSPFRVEVDLHDPASNELRVLHSEYVWFDPAPYLEGRDAVDVYLDPKRPERHLVDLSFLPRRAD
ncbi:MAG: DUF3592 domain-containing protein [Gaiellales bacterium]